MNKSTEKRFNNLDPDDKLTTLITYVQDLDVDCKTVLKAACKETNDHKVSNKAVATIMGNLPKTTMRTPKKQKNTHRVSPLNASKQSTSSPRKPSAKKKSFHR